MRCLSTTSSTSSSPARRTANYQPTVWDDSYIRSLSIDFMEKYVDRRDKLKEKVRCLINHQHDIIEQLELVDALCQLGLDYHFDSEIKGLLSSISSSTENINNLIENGNLHGSALLFRLLREHDINDASILRDDALISCFKKERGSFNPNQQHDIKGILSFYEASYFAMEGEEELYEAGKIVTEHLRCLDKSLLSQQLVEKINHALELPLHWRMPREHARWFINAYGRQENVNPTLLELAKLDFNIVQNIYKVELQEMSRWWRNLGLVCDELNFARDRLVENYLWAVGFTFQPEFWRIRKATTKLNCFITIIDDIYDVYGTLDELELFTNAIKEWRIDADASQQLPNYMKICLNALFNTMNDIATSFSMEKELDILPCLKRVAEIQRGDVSKSIQCYMKEKNISESVARDHIRSLIRNYWKKLNREHTKFSKSLKSFRNALIDVPRTAQFFYQYGDGYGESDVETKDQIISLVIEPISL